MEHLKERGAGCCCCGGGGAAVWGCWRWWWEKNAMARKVRERGKGQGQVASTEREEREDGMGLCTVVLPNGEKYCDLPYLGVDLPLTCGVKSRGTH
jgi:hypothetical protein